MKNGIVWVVITTVLLVLIVVCSGLNIGFQWIFALVCIGQAALLYTVYRVLKSPYTTDKTFDDFYEDFPVDR
ncbi:MAG: hypothetical protein R3359_02145 [Marinirhabdus sp.]|nr:hypothetical protein [Marinirhabdus sp.]